jgi:hypothetical protein
MWVLTASVGRYRPNALPPVVIVSWIDKRSLSADSDAVLVFLGLLLAQQGCSIAASGCNCRPGPSGGHCWGAFNLRSQRFHFLMKLLVLFLADVLVVFDLLEFVLGDFDCCGLMSDDIFQGADKFPHLLGGDPTRRI